MALTYDLEIDEIGVGVTQVLDLASTSYALSALSSSASYRTRVRLVDITSNVRSHSPWSAWTTFETLAAPSGITIQLGYTTKNQTLYPVSTVVENPIVTTTTYDIELTESGQSPVIITDIASSPHLLTGINAEILHTVRVRQVKSTNGVKQWSPWSAPTDFTTLAGGADVSAALGFISKLNTLYAVTPDVPPLISITETYDLKLTEVGVGTTTVTGISSIPHALTGLVDSADYQVQIRRVKVIDTVTTWSNWSTTVDFTAGTQTQPVAQLLSLLANTQTLNAITPVVDNPATPVVVNIGRILITSSLYPVTVNIEGASEIPATSWDVSVRNILTDTVVEATIVNQNNYQLTSLAPATLFGVKIRGRAVGQLSDWTAESTFITSIPAVYASTFESSTMSMDSFYVTLDDSVKSTGNNVTDFFGVLSTLDIDGDVMVTFEGQTLAAKRLGTEWFISMIGDRLGIADPDELNRKDALLLSGDMQITGNDGFLITGLTI